MVFLFAVFLVTFAFKFCIAETTTNDALEQRMNEVMVTMETVLHDNHLLHADNKWLKADNHQLMLTMEKILYDNQQLTSKMSELEERLEGRACEFMHCSIKSISGFTSYLYIRKVNSKLSSM